MDFFGSLLMNVLVFSIIVFAIDEHWLRPSGITWFFILLHFKYWPVGRRLVFVPFTALQYSSIRLPRTYTARWAVQVHLWVNPGTSAWMAFTMLIWHQFVGLYGQKWFLLLVCLICLIQELVATTCNSGTV